MAFSKTNIPGYMKDKKTNVIVPNNVDDKVRQAKANRQQYKEFQQLKKDVAYLQDEITKLRTVLQTLVGGASDMIKRGVKND